MKEVRALTAEARATGDDEKSVHGTGIIYDQWTELWPGYVEKIARGAVNFADTVKAYFNHNPSNVLSTLESTPPLEIEDGEDGLTYTSPIPPTSYGRDLQVNLERSNVKGSSFAFSVPQGGDRIWEDDDGVLHREISKLTLYEVGPVTDPAFVQTSASLRSTEKVLEEWQSQQPSPEPVSRELRRRRLRLMKID